MMAGAPERAPKGGKVTVEQLPVAARERCGLIAAEMGPVPLMATHLMKIGSSHRGPVLIGTVPGSVALPGPVTKDSEKVSSRRAMMTGNHVCCAVLARDSIRGGQ